MSSADHGEPEQRGPCTASTPAQNRPGLGRRGWRLAWLFAFLAVTGCSGAHASLGPGPLGAGREAGDSWEVCAPFYPSGQYALGLDVLSNPGHQKAVLAAVELVGNDHFTLEDALVVPVQQTSVGVGEWPPAQGGPAWLLLAVPVDQAVVPAGADGSRNVVLRLSVPTGQSATLYGWRIRYDVGGAPYEVESNLIVRVRPSC